MFLDISEIVKYYENWTRFFFHIQMLQLEIINITDSLLAAYDSA